MKQILKPCPRCVVGGYHAFAGECCQCGGKRTVLISKSIFIGHHATRAQALVCGVAITFIIITVFFLLTK